MTELLYPNRNDFSYTREQRKKYAMFFIAILFGVGIGMYSSYPKTPEPIIIFDPINIPSSDETFDNTDVWQIIILEEDKSKTIDLNKFNWYYNQSMKLYIHPFNSSLTEYHLDQRNLFISNSTDTFWIENRFIQLDIVPSTFPAMFGFWFWNS